jgi:sugar phosphate isomerase/epimerase
MTQRELGINGFSWHRDADALTREGETAAQLGFRWIMGDGGVWAEGVLETAVDALGKSGLKFWSVHGITGVKGWEFDIPAAIERMGAQIRRAGDCGVGNIAFHTLVNSTDREPAPVVAVRRHHFTQRFHELFGKLAPMAESHGVSINVENIEGAFDSAFRCADEILSVTEPVNSPAMGVCLDSGHAHMSGISVGNMIRRLGPRMRETHFHDNRGDADDHRPIGVGTIDWVDVIYALDEIDYQHPAVFEWAGTYWTKIDFGPMARTFYANWRYFEEYAHLCRERQT